MSTLLLFIVSVLSAVAPSGMPDNGNYANIAHAQTASLSSSLLAVSDIPHPPEKPLALEENEEFPEILNRIAFCESGGKQFDENGQVIRGKINPNDIGKYQINLWFHWKEIEKLGYDIFTEKGNEKYALWLYNKNGTKDWIYSKSCWEKKKAL